MTRGTAVRGFLTAMAIAIAATSASAQVFGTFSWQMQPYCNTVTLTLTSVTGNFTLDGSDDMCGAAKKASAAGIGVFNPDGSVGINFTIVLPTGRSVDVAASVSPANGQGSWTDSAGNSGTFAFFGNTPALPVRPSPTTGIGTITQRSNTSASIGVGSSGSVTASCLAGEIVLSGGNDGFTVDGYHVVASRRSGTTGWTVFLFNASASPRTVTAHVYCLAP